MERIWYDKRMVVNQIIAFAFFCLLLGAFIISHPQTKFETYLNYFLIGLAIVILYFLIKMKYVLLTDTGIRIKKAIFYDQLTIPWNQVTELKLKGEENLAGALSFKLEYLIIKTNKSKYQFVIKDSKGFVYGLEFLKKDRLLIKK